MKRFIEWIRLKEKIDQSSAQPQFSTGEVWWCNVGENIGSEINGKSTHFTRPVLVFRKFTYNTFFGLPLTSKITYGTWYAVITFKYTKQSVILNQGRTFNVKRLRGRMGQLNEADFTKVKVGFHRLFFDISSLPRGSRENPEYE